MTSRRPYLHEGAAATPLSRIEELTGIGADRLRQLFAVRSGRLRSDLSLPEDPFVLDGSTIATSGVAGILQLGPNVEVEIVPKCYLPDTPYWRDDFLFMATVMKYGRLFRRERIAATRQDTGEDLRSILAEIFLYELEELIRVPIREYCQRSWTDHEIDGELDYSEVWNSHPDGFAQTGSRLSIDNPYMAAIGKAARYLVMATTDGSIRQQLERRAIQLGDFENLLAGLRVRTQVPGRHSRWQDLYDLARDVLSGDDSLTPSAGMLRAPGFLLNTQRSWEEVLGLALMTRARLLGTKIKPRLVLGQRIRAADSEASYAHTEPDILLDPPSLSDTIVVDAKYKGRLSEPLTVISRADIYESLGFMIAANSNLSILVYPDSAVDTAVDIGTIAIFDEVVIEERRVIGVVVNIRGIGRGRGFTEFANQFGQSLLEIAAA